MKKLSTAVALALLGTTIFAAPAPPKVIEADLRAAATLLKDQDSAKFKGIQFIPGDSPEVWTMCGFVNSKNSYGGYGGFERFIGVAQTNGKNKPHYIFLRIGEVADQVCMKYLNPEQAAVVDPSTNLPSIPSYDTPIFECSGRHC